MVHPDEVLKKYRDQLKKTKLGTRKPSEGIWYYIWLDPKPGEPNPRSRAAQGWKLEVLLDVEFPEALPGHPEAWKHFIAPSIAEHYGLKGYDASLVARIPYGMPRGRVGRSASVPGFEVEGDAPGKWYLYHGGDFPSGLSKGSELKTLVNRFNLTHFELRGLVEFKHATHEEMDEADKKKIQELIGEVPY